MSEFHFIILSYLSVKLDEIKGKILGEFAFCKSGGDVGGARGGAVGGDGGGEMGGGVGAIKGGVSFLPKKIFLFFYQKITFLPLIPSNLTKKLNEVTKVSCTQ